MYKILVLVLQTEDVITEFTGKMKYRSLSSSTKHDNSLNFYNCFFHKKVEYLPNFMLSKSTKINIKQKCKLVGIGRELIHANRIDLSNLPSTISYMY